MTPKFSSCHVNKIDMPRPTGLFMDPVVVRSQGSMGITASRWDPVFTADHIRLVRNLIESCWDRDLESAVTLIALPRISAQL